MKRAWILLHPSVREGWGLTIIESASQGTPSIGYDVPGIRDSIIQGNTGILVNKGKPDEIAYEAKRLISNKKLYYRMSKQAQHWSSKFTWEKSLAQSLHLVEQL